MSIIKEIPHLPLRILSSISISPPRRVFCVLCTPHRQATSHHPSVSHEIYTSHTLTIQNVAQLAKTTGPTSEANRHDRRVRVSELCVCAVWANARHLSLYIPWCVVGVYDVMNLRNRWKPPPPPPLCGASNPNRRLIQGFGPQQPIALLL